MSANGSPAPKRLRIGVDVGGTNTDGVILDPARAGEETKGIIAWHKAPTTTNPSHGIGHAIREMFAAAHVAPEDVASVTIGTTHFVNAVVERDSRRLSPVAVLRLCGPFSAHTPPCVDWPDDLRTLLLKHYALLPGGLEVDGRRIGDIDEAAIRAECDAIRAKGIRSVVVSGVFSPLDTVERQEERAGAVVRAALPGCDVVLSRDVANLGFVERENAAILNAAIVMFARKTIRAFYTPVRQLGLRCPVFVTQNDGTILSGAMALRLPIRTFSSGPTNSMRGAAFLVRGNGGVDGGGKKALADGPIMVVDIGGTTTDVGLLLASGFPRQQAAYSDLAGVRMNFPCPDIKSIGLGGGSIVRPQKNDSSSSSPRLTVGPDSTGYKLTEEAVVFGGTTPTLTDCAVLADPVKHADIGDPARVQGMLTPAEQDAVQTIVRQRLERVIDTMKTAPDDLPVLLVGGGAIIAPDTLKGASVVLKPRWASVANAIGAATARVSAVIDTVQSTGRVSTSALLKQLSADAVARAIEAGAAKDTVQIVEMETLPLQYIANKARFIVRAAGDFDYERTDLDTLDSAESTSGLSNGVDQDEDGPGMDEYEKSAAPLPSTNAVAVPAAAGASTAAAQVDIDTYRPTVRNRQWYVNETDLQWISSGCYILGTGGGGSPYPHMVRLRQMLRAGAVVRVVSLDDLADDAQVGTGGGMGSPTVSMEKLPGNEMLQSQQELARLLAAEGRPAPTHMIAVEIGGGNGLQSMLLGASTLLDRPVVDGDWMGRAYPTMWQTTPVVFDERRPVWSPVVIDDGNGNTAAMQRAVSDEQAERTLRVALSEMGSHVGCAQAPVTGAETKRWAVEHTISQAWRIGRAVDRWKGKIVGVKRMLRMGHVYGECIIEGADVVALTGEGPGTGSTGGPQPFVGRVKIPFKNENIAVLRMPDGLVEGSSDDEDDEHVLPLQEDVLALVPDLIAVIDAQDGEAIGSPEYRYGLLVTVLGITASDRWTSTDRAIALGGPAGFGYGFDHLTFTPQGTYVKPRSVIDEFNESSAV
ncbi:hydantoinase [Niveomyces insectorum RCEF 264]|uniref:Hydantoinase n=1 Tax=Niveomyces insectorum RCEF 264 TaxID=1081102 RepID=A0A167NPW6_9HYPO|nr:hydantoinase [Niveomyces insectorum RCEF 264]